MSDERLALPGFYPPDAPKNAFRVYAHPDGTVELPIVEHLPLDAPMGNYEVFITTEFGREMHLHVTAGTGHVVTRLDKNDKTKAFVLRIRPSEIVFLPGTYMVRVTENNVPIYTKSMTVPSHPVSPWARDPLPPPGETTAQVFQKID